MRRVFRWLFRIALVALLLVTVILVFFRWQAARREARSTAELAPSTGRFVKGGDVQIFIQEAGPPEGPAILFVHGTGAWSETWKEPMSALARAGFHAIAIDLPPFGYSERPAPPRYAKDVQGRRILGVLDALRIPRVILVGHSFGGGPTMECVLLAPGRVRALVLVDVALSLDDGAAHATSPAVKAVLVVPPLRDALVAAFLTNPSFTRRLLQSFIADPAKATEDRVAIYRQPLAAQGTTRAVGAWLPALLAPERASRSENPASYAALKMPALVLWGGLDTITPLPQGQRLARLLPEAKLVVMKNVGHIPQIEDTAGFDELLLGFVSGLPPDQAAPPS